MAEIGSIHENEGYLVLIRLRGDQELSEFIHAVQANRRILDAHHGYVLGFAWVNDIRIYEEQVGMSGRHQWRKPAACLLWFKGLKTAMAWFDTAKFIKQPDFPNSYPFQLVAVPLNRACPDGTPFDAAKVFTAKELTILWTEYPASRDGNCEVPKALKNYSVVASHWIKKYGGSPFVATSRYIPVLPYGTPTPRVACTFKTSWVDPWNVIAVTCFPNIAAVEAFYYNESVQNAIVQQYRVIRGTSVAMTFYKLPRE